MPTCVIAVTTPRNKIPDGFLERASAKIAKQLGKPESVTRTCMKAWMRKNFCKFATELRPLIDYVTIRLETDQMMCHGGNSKDPCGSIVLYSIGALGAKNKSHGKELGQFIEDELGIDSNRFYITFVDVRPQDCAYGKSTFA